MAQPRRGELSHGAWLIGDGAVAAEGRRLWGNTYLKQDIRTTPSLKIWETSRSQDTPVCVRKALDSTSTGVLGRLQSYMLWGGESRGRQASGSLF